MGIKLYDCSNWSESGGEVHELRRRNHMVRRLECGTKRGKGFRIAFSFQESER